MYKLDYKAFIIIILSIFLIALLTKSCNDKKAYDLLKVDLDNVTKIKDSLGNVITVKDAQIVQNEQSIKDLRQAFFQTSEKYERQIKEVKALIIQRTEVRVDTVEVPIIDTGKMKKWADSISLICKDVIKYYEDSTVLVGTQAKDSTAYYKINATIQKNNLKINEIKFIDSQYISITEFKGGLFKRNTKGKLRFYEPRRTKVEIKHTNPYFENKNVDAFFYEKKRNFDMNSFIKGGVIGAAVALLLIAL